MQTTQHTGADSVTFVPRCNMRTGASLSAAAMALHLRRTHPESARCFALQMREHAGWANAAWDIFWADVASLV